jgi:RsiW-degrading membrane proteinase PrsW (M82 family)
METEMTQIIDTVFLALSGLFFFVMFFFYAALPSQPAPYSDAICMFLSVASFGAAGYRATH